MGNRTKMSIDPRGNSVMSSGIGIPEFNIRKWFQSLTSGSDRCMALTIADEVFNGTFISLASSGIGGGNKSRNRLDSRKMNAGMFFSLFCPQEVCLFRI